MRGRPTPSGGGVPPQCAAGAPPPRPRAAPPPRVARPCVFCVFYAEDAGRCPRVSEWCCWPRVSPGGQRPSGPSGPAQRRAREALVPAAAATQVLAGSSSPAGRCGDAPAGGLFVFTGPVRCAV